jgi:hypothetical protein
MTANKQWRTQLVTTPYDSLQESYQSGTLIRVYVPYQQSATDPRAYEPVEYVPNLVVHYILADFWLRFAPALAFGTLRASASLRQKSANI